MKFGQPSMLWVAAFLAPTMALFFYVSWQIRQKLIAQFVHVRLIASLTVGISRQWYGIRSGLIVLGAVAAAVSLARPQFGIERQELVQSGLDILVAIDTSKSMLAQDVAPSRIGRAKLAALDLLRLARSDRMGLVAFAGTAFLQCPLTIDDESFRQNLELLNVGIIPQGGTDLSAPIDVAMKAMEKSAGEHQVLILFTDGEDQDNKAMARAEEAAKKGLRIFTVGVGTSEGELLKVPGEAGFLRDEDGHIVKSRLNESLLRSIAEKTRGFYLPLQGADTMKMLYERGLARLPKSESGSRSVQVYRERYQFPLLLAFLVLAIEVLLPERSREKPSSKGMAQAAAILLVFLVPQGLKASSGAAFDEYQKGDYERALQEYERLSDKQTNDARLQFNAGASAFKLGEFDRAQRHFDQASRGADLKLQEHAFYNLGNSLYQIGNPLTNLTDKISTLEKAVTNYEFALKLDAQDKDAAFNRDVVKKMVEELRKQQQQQQQQQNKQGTNSQDKSNQDDQKQNQQNDQNKDSKAQQQKSQDQPQDPSKDPSQQQQNKQQQENDPQKQQGGKEPQDQDKKKQEDGRQASSDKDKGQPKEDPQKKQSGQQPQAGQNRDEQDQVPDEPPVEGKMSAQEARRFLDSQKQGEKTLIFAPPETSRQKGRLRDW